MKANLPPQASQERERRAGRASGVLPLVFLALVSIIFFDCQGPATREESMHHEAVPTPELSPEFARERDAVSTSLPRKVGTWTRADKPQVVTSKNIFDYMDGAGELYVGYRFRQLDVYNYTAGGQDDIQVELYWMETADDAFGLLSNDWGGDPVDLRVPPPAGSKNSTVPVHRALYGQGLLRMTSDTMYARIMAFKADEASAAAVVDIGRAIAAGRANPPAPRLVALLPVQVNRTYRPRPDRLCFFRSHLVLNSMYFLGTGNLLNLGLKGEAVTVPYESPAADGKRNSIRTLLIRYPGEPEAREALRHFLGIYVPEKTKGTMKDQHPSDSDILKIEDGWMGYQLRGAYLGLVFECPDADVARSFLNQALQNAAKSEAVHE